MLAGAVLAGAVDALPLLLRLLLLQPANDRARRAQSALDET